METEGAEDGGEVPFFASGVDKTTRGEGAGIEGAEAGEGDRECEDEAADGAEDFRTKCLLRVSG